MRNREPGIGVSRLMRALTLIAVALAAPGSTAAQIVTRPPPGQVPTPVPTPVLPGQSGFQPGNSAFPNQFRPGQGGGVNRSSPFGTSGRLGQNQQSSPFGRNQRANQSRSRRTGRNQPGTAGQAGGGRATITQRQRRARTPTSYNLIQGGDAYELPKIFASPLIETDTVYFSPAEYSTPPGHRFTTPLVFYNINDRAVDRIDLWIRYNPESLDPVWIGAATIEGNVIGGLRRDVWREQGYIHLEARFATPRSELIQPIVSITWQAADMEADTQIRLSPPPGQEIGVYEGDLNCMQISRIGNDGLVSANVRIEDDSPPETRDELPMRLLTAGQDPMLPADRQTRGVHLGLVPSRDRVRPGEIGLVDVVLINPAMAEFDDLRFRLRYDPSAIDILDADEQNYISHGLNIFDGDFHDAMPFEFHHRNTVDPIRGTIDYWVASAVGLKAYRSGVVARIVFRMKREAGAAMIWFEGLDPASGRLASDVRARGRSLLGNGHGSPADALHNVQILVAAGTGSN